MINISKVFTLLALSFVIGCANAQDSSFKTDVNHILKNIKAPEFKDAIYNITTYGAIADGQTDCKPAFDKAINLCSVNGGGQVLVPKGKFYIAGPVVLKSYVNLHFEDGAELIFSGDPKDYLPAVLSLWDVGRHGSV